MGYILHTHIKSIASILNLIIPFCSLCEEQNVEVYDLWQNPKNLLNIAIIGKNTRAITKEHLTNITAQFAEYSLFLCEQDDSTGTEQFGWGNSLKVEQFLFNALKPSELMVTALDANNENQVSIVLDK